jgi:hypothetical protein
LLYGWTLTNDEYIICLLQRYRKLKYWSEISKELKVKSRLCYLKLQ